MNTENKTCINITKQEKYLKHILPDFFAIEQHRPEPNWLQKMGEMQQHV